MDADQYRLFHAAYEKCWNYSTSLFLVLGQQDYAYCGSGTLVLVGDRRCLLTAGHVWDRALRHYDELLFSIASNRPTVHIKRSGLKVLYCSPRLPDPQVADGPDLALIELSEEYYERLEACGKSFYVLAARKDYALSHRPATGDIKGLLGTPGEFVEWAPENDVRVRNAEVGVSMIISKVHRTLHREPWDYVDLSLDNKAQDSDEFPQHYGGMSGSGLWYLGVAEDNKLIWDSSAILEGVAFVWDDSPGRPEDETIRCHGPRSIYEVLPSLI
jgi:hypothetical protein